MFGRRPDGRLAQVSPIRRFMPFISPTRNGALVYFTQQIDVRRAEAWLAERNAGRAHAERVTLFHLVLAAIAEALHRKPRLNRFITGSKVWDRDGVWLSFSAKQAFAEDAPIMTVKRRFVAQEPVEAIAADVWRRLGAGRSGEETLADKEVGLMLKLPGVLIRLLLGLARFADRHGLLPRSMIETDPLFASVFVANLGSVGLDAGYHHLWEWGNCPIFAVMGAVEAGQLTMKYSYDERIADGFYAARGLEVIKALLEAPEALVGEGAGG